MSEREDARTRAFEVISRQNEMIGRVLPGYSRENPVAKIADAYFTPPPREGDAPEVYSARAMAAKIRANHQAISTLLEPGGDHQAAVKYLSQTGMPSDIMRDFVRVGREGWVGPGWSHSERQAYMAKNKQDIAPWELGAGDRLNYQRRLDSWFLAEVAKAHAQPEQKQPAADILSLADSPRVFDNEGGYQKALAHATYTHKNAGATANNPEGEKYASRFLGSKYPWHQGGGALEDAMSNTDSPFGWFMSHGSTVPDAISFARRSDREPITSAATTFEGRRNFSKSSPIIPDGPPEKREEFMQKVRSSLAGPGGNSAAYPMTQSEHVWRTTGSPPSYASQIADTFLENLPDVTTAAMMFSPKVLLPIAKSVGRSGVPVAARYGAHIARKTAPSAVLTPARIAINETREDVPLLAGLMSVDAAHTPDRPTLSQAFSGGAENRPDMRATVFSPDLTQSAQIPMNQMSDDQRQQYWKERDQNLEDSHKFLEQANRAHPNSSLDSPLGKVMAPVMNTAADMGRNLYEAAGTANKANRGSWFPSIPIMPMR